MIGSQSLSRNSLLFAALFALFCSTAYASVDTCPADFKDCEISGYSRDFTKTGESRTVYSLRCQPFFETQLEGQLHARWLSLVDTVSHNELKACPVNEASAMKFAQLIADYSRKADAIENPKCYLTQWKGQMAFMANKVHGRCSFRLNEVRAQAFTKATGVVPLYQCENDYFLVAPAHEAPQIYAKTESGWRRECQAAIRVGEAVEQIDWKNPPAYYEP